MRAKHKHCAPASWPMDFINDNNLRLCPHCYMPYVSQDGRHAESCQHNPNRLNTPDRRRAAQTTSTPAQSPRRPAVMPAAAAAGAAPAPATLAPQEVRARVPDGPPDMPNWPEAYNDQLKQWIDSQDHDETDLALCHTMRRVPSTAMLAWTTVHNYVLMQHLRYPDDPRILRLYSYLPRLLLQQKHAAGWGSYLTSRHTQAMCIFLGTYLSDAVCAFPRAGRPADLCTGADIGPVHSQVSHAPSAARGNKQGGGEITQHWGCCDRTRVVSRRKTPQQISGARAT